MTVPFVSVGDSRHHDRARIEQVPDPFIQSLRWTPNIEC
jgi:hypothetical protein